MSSVRLIDPGQPRAALMAGAAFGRWWLVTAASAALSVALAPGAMAQTTRTWNVASGDWSIPGNWSPSGVPGPMDTVVIGSGTCTANAAVSVAGLTLQSGTLAGSGLVRVTGTLTWSGGTMMGTGTTRLEAGGTFVSSVGTVSLRRTLEIGATVGGITNTFAVSGGVLSILAGGSLTLVGPNQLGYSGGTAALVNAGTLTISALSFTLPAQIPLTNTGTVEFLGQGPALTVNSTTNLISGTLAGGRWVLRNALVRLGTINAIAPGTILEIEGTSSSITQLTSAADGLSGLSSLSGELRLNNKTLMLTPAGGTLTNSGRLLVRGGAVLSVTGVYEQTSTATLRDEFTGLTSTMFGRVSASTMALLGGTLETAILPPYSPVSGQGLGPIVSSPSITGGFAHVCTDARVNGLAFVVTPTPVSIGLRVDPQGAVAPTIDTQPVGITRDCANSGPVRFTVVASGGGLSYQWRRNGTNLTNAFRISGATTSQLDISPCVDSDAGTYDCVVTNACSMVASHPAVLVWNLPTPAFVVNPQSTTACVQSTRVFTAAAVGTEPLAYRWWFQWDSGTSVNGLTVSDGSNGPIDGATFVASGALTPELSISWTGSTSRQSIGLYCAVTGACAPGYGIASEIATFALCMADFNCVGGVTVQDVFDFLVAYFAGDPRADVNGVGGVTVQDVFDFLTAYFSGCA